MYLNDIIIFSISLQEHDDNLRKVFTRSRGANLKVQLDKCKFMSKEIAFLGNIVAPNSVKSNPSKIAAIQKFPVPKNAKEIKSFSSLSAYYRKFNKDFPKITKPLIQCLKRDEKSN